MDPHFTCVHLPKIYVFSLKNCEPHSFNFRKNYCIKIDNKILSLFIQYSYLSILLRRPRQTELWVFSFKILLNLFLIPFLFNFSLWKREQTTIKKSDLIQNDPSWSRMEGYFYNSCTQHACFIFLVFSCPQLT